MPGTKLAQIIGERLRLLRKENHLSQEELAHLSHLHPTYIGQLERGEKNATLDTVSKVAKALDVTLDELFRFSTEPDEDNQTLNQLNNQLDETDRETVLKIINVMLEWKNKT
ncbi:helix-turn-helix domain-containing protein [Aquibacillus saliphilus]|uniref:helix-turn-helix domain-containing protein n=1 Tax=Aquibacillus saliphilus TaxID=1909422 RepID=UPI001CF061E8|nr:helix-turn-helix transcriptional regulator [Aquibacillus saliphilus]